MRKLLFLSIGILSVVFISAFSLVVWAKESEMMVDVVTTSDSITLNMNNAGEYYRIYQSGKKIWEGNDKSHTINNLKGNHPYTFEVAALNDKKEIIDLVRVKTNTLPTREFFKNEEDERKRKLNELKKAEISAVIGKDRVILQWDKIPDDDMTFELYRNGKLVKKDMKEKMYVDKDVKPNEQYLYQLIGTKELSKQEKEKVIKEAKEKNIPIPQKEKLKDTYILTKPVKTLGNDFNKVIQESDASAFSCIYTPGYAIRYQTFIPYKKVTWPLNRASDVFPEHFPYQFGGDNRGYDEWSNKYRTRTEVRIVFDCDKTTVQPWYGRGETIGYDKKGNIIYRGYAELDGIKLTVHTRTLDLVNWTLNHDVGIPFYEWATPDISYSYTATVYKSGDVYMSGWHDGAPSHEIYIMSYPGDFSFPLYQFWVKDFLDLFPFRGNYFFEVRA